MVVWLIVANSETCKIFDYKKNEHQLTLVKKLNHFQSKLKGSELISDRPGHYQTYSTARGTYSSNEDPKEVEFEKFSREIAHELDKARKANQYNHLTLIAPPHMTGLINLHLDIHVKNCIKNNLIKDYVKLTERELLEMLKKEHP